ncbi:MAG: type I methionyl aminopeptidase [Gemmatimonadetes bacterium]|nr:type I methionyl aminopeptidase [Gemmatimonadota bacterium]
MITLRNRTEIARIRAACQVVARVLRFLEGRVEPGVSTGDLDRWAEEFILRHPGAEPAFKGLYGFPCTLCTSVNEEVVHGIPTAERELREGDIVSIDVGVRLDGYYGDAAVTIPVGEPSPRARQLLEATKLALQRGIEAAQPGAQIGDISAAIQETVEAAGFSVVRELVGHGIGTRPHEEPQVPNYGRRGQGVRLRAGLVIAIEPMVNAGGHGIRTLDDDWTIVTADGGLSAHFEHTVAITERGAAVLSALEEG